jgi:hypothetical protein
MFKNKLTTIAFAAVFVCTITTVSFTFGLVSQPSSINNVDIASDPGKYFQIIPQVFATGEEQIIGCMWGVSGSLPSSQTYDSSAPWNIDFVAPTIVDGYKKYASQFLDINGDGMTDYLYVYDWSHPQSGYSRERCVYLNNGSGWNLAYICTGNRGLTGPWTYYGDCAG